jgi:hypothetical protein
MSIENSRPSVTFDCTLKLFNLLITLRKDQLYSMDYVGATYVLLQTCFTLHSLQVPTQAFLTGIWPLINLYYANNSPRFAYYTYTVKKG